MQQAQQRLLELLEGEWLSIKDLATLTRYSRDGIRGRISELHRDYNYTVKKEEGRYHTTKDERVQHAEDVIAFIKDHQLTGHQIPIERLVIGLKLPRNKIIDALHVIFQKGQLFQVSNDVVKIYRI